MHRTIVIIPGSISSALNLVLGLFIIVACNDGLCGSDKMSGYIVAYIISALGMIGLAAVVLGIFRKVPRKYIDPVIIVNLVVFIFGLIYTL